MEVYKLKYPIEWDSKTVTEIEVRRPKGKHVKKLGDKTSNLEAIMEVIGINVTDYTPSFYDELDGADYIGVAELIGSFLEDGLKTGNSQ